MRNTTLRELLEQQEKQRSISVKKILESSSPKKIIVSSPGTGKTFLFGKIFQQRTGKYLAPTFINNLANKLKDDLENLARCCTFHSFCKSLLHRIPRVGIDDNFEFYTKLDLVIKSDANLLLNKNFDFNHCFNRLERESEELNFFIKRSNYYNAASFDDSVYRVLKHFEDNEKDIPRYDQIAVDEYQDFNMLEVAFINILATKNPILIVGDDDQALYGQLKDASADYIREKFRDKDYMHFLLPFCSRCTEVIVDAIKDVVLFAKRTGRLKERVDKPCICFLPDKLADSKKYPKLTYVYCSVQTKKLPYMAKFIEQEIDKLAERDVVEANKKGDYTVLVTGPHHYLEQVYIHLIRRKEWQIIYNRKKEHIARRPNLVEGYKILLKTDKFSNLGWRILLECSHSIDIKAILKKAIEHNNLLYKYLPKSFLKQHELILSLLEKVKNDIIIREDDREKLKSIFSCSIEDLKLSLIEDGEEEIMEEEEDKNKISIILTTYVGCKGLSAGYVFVVGLNEGTLPKNNKNPRDIEICQFIVALARTIKRCYLIYVRRFGGGEARRYSTFIDWINTKRLVKKSVDKNYWL